MAIYRVVSVIAILFIANVCSTLWYFLRKAHTFEGQSCSWTDPNSGIVYDISPLKGSSDYKINYDPTKPVCNSYTEYKMLVEL
jgi:hypothetical protein